MATYYREEDSKKWIEILDTVYLKAFGERLCKAEAYKDSDGGYEIYFEFYRNGERTFCYADYDGYSDYYKLYGGMASYVYGTAEEIKKLHPYITEGLNPDRDWIIV